jgi:hypothetical protein
VQFSNVSPVIYKLACDSSPLRSANLLSACGGKRGMKIYLPGMTPLGSKS